MIGGTALASGQRFAVNVTNADSSTNEPVVFSNETHSAANAYGILIKYSGSSGNWSSGTGQNFIRCTDDGESNQKFAVTGAGQVQAQTGIAFGGDTATANTLDDYEEGSWTPDISGSSSTSGVGYATREGNYTKVGNMVTANFNILFNDKGSMSGTTRITGLPFSGNNAPQQQSCSMQTANMNVDKDQTVVAIQYAVNALAYLYVQESGLALSQISGNSQYTDTSQFIGSLTYFTNS